MTGNPHTTGGGLEGRLRSLLASPKARRAGAALSLANLCYLHVWASLLTPSYQFYAQAPPPPASYAAALVGLGVLTVLLVGVLELWESRQVWLRAAGGVIFFLLLLNVGNALLLELVTTFPAHLWPRQTALFFGLYASAVIGLLTWRGWLLRVAEGALLVLLPFALLTVGQGVWGALSPERPPYKAKPPAPRLEASVGRPRVVWVIFDELDYRDTFEVRPASVRLPEFDRLSSQALVATRAYPPNPWTDHSMPALLLGRNFLAATPAGPADVWISFSHGTVRWSEQETIFDRARELGVNTALAGSYIPFCRILGDSLTRLAWAVFGTIGATLVLSTAS
jgi:hypothetical protein